MTAEYQKAELGIADRNAGVAYEQAREADRKACAAIAAGASKAKIGRLQNIARELWEGHEFWTNKTAFLSNPKILEAE